MTALRFWTPCSGRNPSLFVVGLENAQTKLTTPTGFPRILVDDKQPRLVSELTQGAPNRALDICPTETGDAARALLGVPLFNFEEKQT